MIAVAPFVPIVVFLIAVICLAIRNEMVRAIVSAFLTGSALASIAPSWELAHSVVLTLALATLAGFLLATTLILTLVTRPKE